MFGWGRPKRPAAIAFDIVGTVFPLAPLRPAIQALGLPAGALEGWFAAGLRDAFALSAAGDFKPFATVLESALDEVLAERGLVPARGARTTLMEQFKHLPARPDAGEAFEIAARAGKPIIALSNGSAATTRSLLKNAGLDTLVTRIVSVDEVRLFKPRREIYDRAARIAKVKRRRLALVAVHSWDINGAKAAGLTTAYVSTDRPFSSVMRAPDVEARSLPEAVRKLAAL